MSEHRLSHYMLGVFAMLVFASGAGAIAADIIMLLIGRGSWVHVVSLAMVTIVPLVMGWLWWREDRRKTAAVMRPAK